MVEMTEQEVRDQIEALRAELEVSRKARPVEVVAEELATWQWLLDGSRLDVDALIRGEDEAAVSGG